MDPVTESNIAEIIDVVAAQDDPHGSLEDVKRRMDERLHDLEASALSWIDAQRA
jgi:hypothetical protein